MDLDVSFTQSFWWTKGHFYIFELNVLISPPYKDSISKKYFEAFKVCDLFLKSMEQTSISQLELWLLFRSIGHWALVESFSWKQKEQSFSSFKITCGLFLFYRIQLCVAVNSHVFEALLNLFFRIQRVLVLFLCLIK